MNGILDMLFAQFSNEQLQKLISMILERAKNERGVDLVKE